jgi:hypothetical protein
VAGAAVASVDFLISPVEYLSQTSNSYLFLRSRANQPASAFASQKTVPGHRQFTARKPSQ